MLCFKWNAVEEYIQIVERTVVIKPAIDEVNKSNFVDIK